MSGPVLFVWLVAAAAPAAPALIVVGEDAAAGTHSAAVKKGLEAKGLRVELAGEGAPAAACVSRTSAERTACFGRAAASVDGLLLVSAGELQGKIALSLSLYASRTGQLLEQEAAKGRPAELARVLTGPLKVIASAVKAQAAEHKGRAAFEEPAKTVEPAPAPKPPIVEPPQPTPPSAPPAPLSGEGNLVKLALYDFKHSGAAELASATVGLAADALQGTRLFKVTTSQALASLLALERQKQLLGCSDDDNSCMAEMADALGVEYIVTGTLTRLPEAISLDLSLLDVKSVRRVASQIVNAKAEAELLAGVRPAIAKLIAPVAEKRQGRLELSVNERDAVVKVDDVARGTTPLAAALTVPGGLRRVSVEKEGFVTWEQPVTIAFNEVSRQAVTLIPSQDYIRAYESKQRRLRVGAWVSTGLTVAAAIAFAVPKIQIEQLNSSTTGFQYYKGRLLAGVETEGMVDNRYEAERLKGEISSRLTASWVALGVGCAAAVAALVFWIISDDPNRYAQFRTAD